MRLFIHCKVEFRLNLLQHAAVRVAAHAGLELLKRLQDRAVLKHMQQLLVRRHAEFDLKQFQKRDFAVILGNILPGERGARLADQTGAEHILLVVEIGDQRLQFAELVGRHRHRTRNDQRRTRFVDQDAVDLVDDGVVIIALDQLGGIIGHTHVAQVVETEFAVRAVRDVAGVLGAALVRRLLVLQATAGQAEKVVDVAHPVRVAQRKVVVDRDELAVLAGEGVQIERHGRDEGFAFAGGHLRDVAAMQRNAAENLDVERNHVPDHRLPADLDLPADQAAAGVLDGGERFAHDVIERFALGETRLEFIGLGAQLVIGELLVLLFDGVDFPDERRHLLEVAFRFRAEYGFENGSQHLISTPADRSAYFVCRADIRPARRSAAKA